MDLLLELSLISLLFFFIAMTSYSLSDRPGSQPRVQGTVISCDSVLTMQIQQMFYWGLLVMDIDTCQSNALPNLEWGFVRRGNKVKKDSNCPRSHSKVKGKTGMTHLKQSPKV